MILNKLALNLVGVRGPRNGSTYHRGAIMQDVDALMFVVLLCRCVVVVVAQAGAYGLIVLWRAATLCFHPGNSWCSYGALVRSTG